MLKNVVMKVSAFVFLVVCLVISFVLLPIVTAAAAGEVIIDEDISKAAGSLEIPAGTTVNGDVTLNLGELVVLGIINGDVKSNMGRVEIIGDVNGNVETNMGQIVISGNVGGNVRTRMGEIVVDGSVAGNINTDLGASSIDGTVGGDIRSGLGELKINGAVGGDITSKGGSVVVNGIVEGDVLVDHGVVELGPQAVVSGKVRVERGRVVKAETSVVGSIEIGEELSPAQIADGALDGTPEQGYHFDGVDRDFGDRIAEGVERAVYNALRRAGISPHTFRINEWTFSPFPLFGFHGSVARGVVNMLIMFALAALTITLFPRQVKAAGEAIPAKPGPVIGWGILAAVLAVPLMVLLAITIIGIPLIIVEIVFLAVAALLGYSGLASLLGEKVIGAASSRPVNQLGALAIGVLIIGLIAMVPLLGALVSLAVFVLAVGAALVTRFGSAAVNGE